MSRTYIGPFGRILPVLNDNDLEQSQVPSHEARSTMTTFQLPPPEKLDFGSDDTLGVTEPLRYSNVGSQAKKAHDRSNPAYSEPPRPHHHGLLPSVSSLLPPVSQSTIPPPRFPPHINAQLSHERINLQLDIRDPGSDRLVQNLQYAYHGSFPQPPAPLQAQSVTSRDSRGSDPQTNTSSHQISTAYNLHQSSAFAYPSHAPRSRELSYSPAQPQHQISPSNAHQVYYTPTPNPHHLQHPSPTDVPQPVQMLAVNAPSQYYQDHPNGYDINSTSTLGAEQTEHCSQPTENNAKPMPRVVGEADIPGQGPSWLYEDGTSCKKIIDGESVNAQWGVTKAGKPRKRLAIACTTCREKKIKCDPAEPKCVQCEKFGRECRFTTA